MDTLSDLGKKYGTDKIGKHHYLPVYSLLFEHRREAIKKVIEIGVAEGAGVRMFRDYFLNAMIYGAEIQQDRILQEDRIITYECDQSFETDLARLVDHTGSDIDLVIDDGSHKPEDQIFTCLTLMPILKKDVVYIIEDVAEPDILEGLYEYDCIMTKLSERYDDRLIIVRHKNG